MSREKPVYIKNTCFWFMRVNKDDKNIKKCRDGSLCKFIHLTREECEDIIKDPNALTDCPSCIFKSSPIPEGLDEFNYIQEKIRREMPCMTRCKNGKILKKDMYVRNARKRNWCECKERSNAYRYPGYSHPSGERDAWVCSKCKCICQVG